MIADVGERVIEPGAFTIAIGGQQPGFTGQAHSPHTQILTGRVTLTGEKVILNDR